jgi:hypothetical protein
MLIQQPNRVVRSYTQHLCAGPDRVFPLLCPVREAEWLERWDPIAVQTKSGAAEVDCVFSTPAAPSKAVWYITRHEPETGFVEMIKITPEVTACKLRIQLTVTPEGCEALVTYLHTSLGPEGDAFVGAFTEEHYLAFMVDWETRLNHFLRTGLLSTRQDSTAEIQACQEQRVLTASGRGLAG